MMDQHFFYNMIFFRWE